MKRMKQLWALLPALALAVLALWAWCRPAGAESRSERRKLAQAPKLVAENLWSGRFMTEFESYSQDQFPLRDAFRAGKAAVGLYGLGQGDSHGIYRYKGYEVQWEYPLNEASLDHAAERFRYVYDTYLKDTGSRVYLSVIPDKNYFLGEASGHLTLDYELLTERIRGNMEYARYIDLFSQLKMEDYYKTDIHWRQERLVPAAQYLAGEMGVRLTGQYTEKTGTEAFRGVYYGQLALPVAGEALKYLDSQALENCTVYDYETGKEIAMYDQAACEGRDPYELFLGGSKSLLTIENPAGDPNRELILFRDSFGSSLAPLLAEGYGKITLVDIRYLSPERLGSFLDFHGQDVLFLYCATVLNNSETIQ